jgi:hypothetical protein
VLSPIIKKEVSLVENFQPVIQNQPPTQRKIGEIQKKRGIFERFTKFHVEPTSIGLNPRPRQ